MVPSSDSSPPSTTVAPGGLDLPHAQQSDPSDWPRITIQPPFSSTPSWSPPPSRPQSSRKRPPPSRSQSSRKRLWRVPSSSTTPSIDQYFTGRDRGCTPGVADKQDTSSQHLTPGGTKYRGQSPRTLRSTGTKVVKHGRSRKTKVRPIHASIADEDEVLEKFSIWLQGLSGLPPIPVDTSVADPPAEHLDDFYNTPLDDFFYPPPADSRCVRRDENEE